MELAHAKMAHMPLNCFSARAFRFDKEHTATVSCISAAPTLDCVWMHGVVLFSIFRFHLLIMISFLILL